MLPKIATPEYSTRIPSTGEKISFRPFLVKEEKILLMAMEGRDQREIETAIKNLLESCILSNIKVSKLATFDIEYLFLKLRAKSVGEVIELKVAHESGDCNHKTPIRINIDEINVSEITSDGKIMLTNDIGIKLRYPGLDDVSNVKTDDSSSIFKLIAGCVEYIYDTESVYNEFTETELNDWIEQLSQEQFKKIADFFSVQPRLKHEVSWKCEKCGKEDSIVIEGLQNFFG